MAGPSPGYDLMAALDAAALGYTLQREQIDAAYAQYQANGFAPLTSAQTAAVLLAGAQTVQTEFDEDILGIVIPPDADPYPDPLPPQYPTGLPRIPDSNEEPFDGWVQYGAQLEGYDL